MLISVIVPCHNGENFIRDTLDKILAQTYQNIEIIIIDDASSDSTPDILREYQSKDKRVHVYTHEQNKGVSAARNRGLYEASGEYVMFVDSDDWVDPYYLESLMSRVETGLPGLVIGGFYSDKVDGVYNSFETLGFFCQNEFHRMIPEKLMHSCGYPWGKVFDLAVIREHGLKFEEGVHYAEDLIFLYNYLLYANYVRFIDCCGYHYDMKSLNSLGLSYHTYESELKGFQKFKEVIEKMKAKYQMTDEELRPTYNRLAYLLLRAVKVMYRPGIHIVEYKYRQLHLRKDIGDYETELLGYAMDRSCDIDRIIYICLKARFYRMLDFILISYFYLRYSYLGVLYMKYRGK